jgi:hypothetical protein
MAGGLSRIGEVIMKKNLPELPLITVVAAWNNSSSGVQIKDPATVQCPLKAILGFYQARQ